MSSSCRLLLNVLHERRYPLCAVGYRRTREHLLSWRAVLPPVVKEASVSISKIDIDAPISPHFGTWLFLYENVPQLRYHNPTVKFTFEANQQPDSHLYFTLENGEVKPLPTTGLRQKEIKNIIEDFITNIASN